MHILILIDVTETA